MTTKKINIDLIIHLENEGKEAFICHPLLKGGLTLRADSPELLQVQLEYVQAPKVEPPIIEPTQFQEIMNGVRELGDKVGNIRKILGR